MLDLRRRVTWAARPDLLIYGDAEVGTAFYALPAAPHVSTDEGGRYQMRLLVYGSGPPARRAPAGGSLVITTSLELSDSDGAAVRDFLREALGGPDEDPPSPIALRPPECVSGTATLQLTADLVLSGQPSLYGNNACVFNASLDATRIGAVLRAWLDRLGEGSIAYELGVRAMPGPAVAEWTLVGPVMPRAADPADYVKYVDL